MRKTDSDDTSNALPGLRRGDFHAAFATGLVALAVYAYTLAPTVTGEDSGELIGAAYTRGVPHPPGYPVWTMLAHLFTWLPVGEVAWRVNLLSAVCAAGTVALLVLIGITLTRNRVASVLGAAFFAVSRVFWEQALIAEVYTLNTGLLALLILLALRSRESAAMGPRYAIALLAGVGTGVHNTQILLLPFWLVYLRWYLPPELRRAPGVYLKLGAFCALGTLVHLYLPLASRMDPAVDWGNPETLQQFWAVLSREQYAFMLHQYPRSLGRLAGQLATMAFFGFRDLLALGALLSIGGFVLLYRRDRFTAVWLVLMAVAAVVLVTLMQNFEQNREWHWVMRVFLLPAELIATLGIISALAWGVVHRPRLQPFMHGLAVAGIMFSLVLQSGQSKRTYFYAEDYGRNLLASLPERAIYVPGPDHQAFPVLYLQVVEGLRPDVTLLRKYGYLDLEAVPGLRAAVPGNGLPYPRRRYEPEVLGWLLANTDRPLVLDRRQSIAGRVAEYRPIGLLVQALRPGETARVERPLEALAWRRPLPEVPVEEYSLSLIQYDVAFAHARTAFANGEPDAALVYAEAAVRYGHREPEALNNVGVLCARNGAYDAAAAYFREILDRHPTHEAARNNLARVERRR